ncbi:MAG TPA: DUF5069 domain-containing protein [Pantanalinema sp.]
MALDLNTQVPRSPFETLEGYAWLPRLIDKARAFYAGTHGDYTPYPCPGDRQFLSYFGLDAGSLGDLIKSGASDEAIADRVKRTAKRTAAETKAFGDAFLVPSPNPLLRFALGLFIKRSIARVKKARPGTDASGIDTMAKVLCLEEGHPIPRA